MKIISLLKGDRKIIIYGFIVFLLATSCNTYKKYTYVRDIPLTGQDSVIKSLKPEYHIQPGDILYVRIITPDQTMGEIFNPFPSGNNSGNLTGQGNMFFFGYTVNDNGYIEIPVIDSVEVGGLTIAQVKKKIDRMVQNYLKESQVIVKMAQFNFTLLGEIGTPGIQTVYKNNVNLIEAISYGGGITYNGDRTEVLIMRSTKEGTKTFQVDLTDDDIVKSPLYYVMPNDIIYVKPRRTTAFRQESSDILFGISALSSVITTALLIWRLEL